MIFGINTACDISKLSQIFTCLTAREITYNNFEISLVVFMPSITTNHAITYTNFETVNSLSKAMITIPDGFYDGTKTIPDTASVRT